MWAVLPVIRRAAFPCRLAKRGRRAVARWFAAACACRRRPARQVAHPQIILGRLIVFNVWGLGVPTVKSTSLGLSSACNMFVSFLFSSIIKKLALLLFIHAVE